MVWGSRGSKRPDFLKDIGGLETNRINQLVVEPTLPPKTTRDPDILRYWRLRVMPASGRGLCSAARSGRTSDGNLRNEQHSGADER